MSIESVCYCKSLMAVDPSLPCTGRQHQMTPAADIDWPSSSWFHLTSALPVWFDGSGTSSEVALTCWLADYMSGDLTSEGINHYYIIRFMKWLFNRGDWDQQVRQVRVYLSSHALGLVVITAWPNFPHCKQLYLRRTNLSCLAPALFNYTHFTRLSAGSTLWDLT